MTKNGLPGNMQMHMRSTEQILTAMTPIGLEEMGGYALMNRVDSKYVFSDSRLGDLLETVSGSYRVLSIEGQRLLSYETLYFDTPGCEYYLQHHNGRLNRRKIRIRRYVVSDLCYLEIKNKNNKGRTKKQRTVVPAMEQHLSESSKKYLSESVGHSVDLVPQLWVEFNRITLVSNDGPERVTLDTNLCFRYLDHQLDLPGLSIAEVKQSKLNRHSNLCEALKQAGVRPLRVSKYCLGTALLKPHLKHNRFKAKLDFIRKIA